MREFLKNWSTQIKKGYLELCVLNLIHIHKKVYGFQILKLLEESNIPVKEGTLYPLLNRMVGDKLLKAVWDTKNIKGHPRKFYSLSKQGETLFGTMKKEFEGIYKNYKKITLGGKNGK